MRLRPSDTSFAILGLIAEHPHSSAYELAKKMELNLAYFWPRARSHLFTEVKKLAVLGYVTARADAAGKRPRTRYAITRAGRKALGGWLARPPLTFALQIEGLLRVFLAPHGSSLDLRGALGSMQNEADKMLAIAGKIIPAYLAGAGPYPQHLHLRAVLIDFLVRFAELVRNWATRHGREVERWDDLALAGKEKWARRVLSELVHRG